MTTLSSLAYVFPGQGSQFVGMLADLAPHYQEVTQTFDEASSVLGYDLWALVEKGPADQLDQTIYTQPALLTASYAIWRILDSRLPAKPSILAGHSLGEYTALVCAKALQFQEAVTLVAARGQFMQEAVSHGVGGMAAVIGLDESTIRTICQEAKQSPEEVITPANYNSIGQVVIAGHLTAVQRAMGLAKSAGAKLVAQLPVSVPSHCALMLPAAERLKPLLSALSINTPTIPVISNAEVEVYQTADAIREGLVKQLYSPVRWVETIQTCVKNGVTQIIECGPGKVLTGLNKRIDKSLQLQSVSDAASVAAFLHPENERSV